MAPRCDSSATPHTVQDYIVLPLTCPAVPAHPHPTTHFLYLRENVPKVATPDTPRQVFLVNLPIDATPQHVKTLFADQLDRAARIERVEFENAQSSQPVISTGSSAAAGGRKRKRGSDTVPLPQVWDRPLHQSGCTAIATFVDATSAQLALRQARKVAADRRIVWGPGLATAVQPLGSARYAAHHRLSHPDPGVLQANVDDFMTAFAEAEARKRKAQASLRQVPDADGFVTVTRGARSAPAPVAGGEAALQRQKERHGAKSDFYRFQHREKLKDHANELIKGFENDRRKVQEMKLKRNKFKPR